MAYQLKFPYTQEGFSFIWNVSAHVGRLSSCPNLATDAELVQFFLRELLSAGVLGTKAAAGAKTPQIQLAGRYDAITGLWLYFSEESNKNPAVVDGIASPARGLNYGGAPWAIAKMNFNYRKIFPSAWETLNTDARLSPALRAELSKTTVGLQVQ